MVGILQLRRRGSRLAGADVALETGHNASNRRAAMHFAQSCDGDAARPSGSAKHRAVDGRDKERGRCDEQRASPTGRCSAHDSACER